MPSIPLPSCSGGKLNLYALISQLTGPLHTLPSLNLRLRIFFPFDPANYISNASAWYREDLD